MSFGRCRDVIDRGDRIDVAGADGLVPAGEPHRAELTWPIPMPSGETAPVEGKKVIGSTRS
jgi:hypothetical protein